MSADLHTGQDPCKQFRPSTGRLRAGEADGGAGTV